MSRFNKALFPSGAVALAAAVLILASPRAAQAISAALVQVTNTPANPAITQGAEKQAAQTLQLYCLIPASVGSAPCAQLLPTAGIATYGASQNFMVTAVDLLPLNGNTNLTQGCGSPSSGIVVSLLTVSSSQPRFQWVVTGPGGAHFAYPNGIVIMPGAAVSMTATNNSGCYVAAYLTGYTTTN